MKKTRGSFIVVFVFASIFAFFFVTSYPMINDISTDLVSVPQFHHIKVKDHGGQEVAKAQQEAYPEILPLDLALPLTQVFDIALKLAKTSGWEIVDSDPKKGRIEATAESHLFKFKDDILLQVSLVPNGTRVDMRSQSRIGKSDLGANAKRIKTFLDQLKAEALRPFSAEQ